MSNDNILEMLYKLKEEMQYANGCGMSVALHQSLDKWISEIEILIDVSQPKCSTCGAPVNAAGCYKNHDSR